MQKEQNKDLQSLNTFGIKVQTEEFVALDSVKDAISFFEQKQEKPILILGGGSNILMRKNFDGITVKNNIKGIRKVEEDEDHIWLEVGAGENWHQFVLYCIENQFAGIENLSLIPGNVGASPMQNIGAYGVEVKELIEWVECVSRKDGSIKRFSNTECNFEYRSSIFKTTHRDQYLIVKVCFRLNKKPNFKISYGAIKDQLELDGINESNLSIKAISDAVIKIRQSKLPDPKQIGNAGSFFKNPVVKKVTYEKLKTEYPNIPAYPQANGEVKLAAGWLIEKAGWKGFKEGSYGVHPKQALVLVNYGGASGDQIYELSSRILDSVESQFGIRLEREVNIIE